MPFIFIRPQTCARCGLCVRVCPVGVLRQPEAAPSAPQGGAHVPDAAPQEPRPIPVVAAGRERHCILCGHCQAVCPASALVHPGLPDDGRAPAPAEAGEAAPEASGPQAGESFLALAAARRSCRHFKREPLTREHLADLCAMARFAPSGHNQRQVEWAVVESRRGMEAVLGLLSEWMDAEARADTELARALNLAGALRAVNKGRDVVLRGAPHLVVAHAPKDGLTPREDALIACAHLDLAAAAQGLGSCWCGYAMFALAGAGRPDPVEGHPQAEALRRSRRASAGLADALGIAPRREGFGALLVGRRAHVFARPAPRQPFPLRFVL